MELFTDPVALKGGPVHAGTPPTPGPAAAWRSGSAAASSSDFVPALPSNIPPAMNSLR